LLFANIQFVTACSPKKLNFKFKLMNTHVHSLHVWPKSMLLLLKYRNFSRGLFFIGAPWILDHWTWCLVSLCWARVVCIQHETRSLTAWWEYRPCMAVYYTYVYCMVTATDSEHHYDKYIC